MDNGEAVMDREKLASERGERSLNPEDHSGGQAAEPAECPDEAPAADLCPDCWREKCACPPEPSYSELARGLR